MSTFTQLPVMAFKQQDLLEARSFQLLYPRTEVVLSGYPSTDLTRTTSQQLRKSDFYVRLRLVTVVHGELGSVPASYALNTSSGLNKASLIILEVSFFTANSSPCRYETLSFSMRFRHAKPATESPTADSTTPPNLPAKPPHVAASAPWEADRSITETTASSSSSHRPGFRRRLNSSDYIKSELPSRLRFNWENTDRNERSSFPTGKSSHGANPDHANLNNVVHWNLETDNPPLTALQLAPSATPQPSGYAGSARATFAVLVQRESDASFVAKLELKVGGDVYSAAARRWGEHRAGYIMPGGASILFDPAAAPVGDAFERGGEEGVVERGEVGAWVEARRGRLEGLRGLPAFRPLRNVEVVEEE